MKVFKMIFVIYFIVTMFVGCDKHTIEKNKLSGLSVRNFLIEHDCNQPKFTKLFVDSVWSMMKQFGALSNDNGNTVYLRLIDWEIGINDDTEKAEDKNSYKFLRRPKINIIIEDLVYYTDFFDGRGTERLKTAQNVVNSMAHDVVSYIGDRQKERKEYPTQPREEYFTSSSTNTLVTKYERDLEKNFRYYASEKEVISDNTKVVNKTQQK